MRRFFLGNLCLDGRLVRRAAVAAVTYSSSGLSPANPTTWTTSTLAFVGYQNNSGWVTIDQTNTAGGTVSCRYGYIGGSAGCHRHGHGHRHWRHRDGEV